MVQQPVEHRRGERLVDMNRSTYSFGVHEQWVYDGGYLYFENGTLKSIQN